jgi:tungstate transport system substrate-binding protein
MKRMLAVLVLFLSVAPGLSVLAQSDTPEPEDLPRLILATTTSTNDSGLLDYILPVFEEEYNVAVDVIAVGTGQALELGRNGDADVELVHARSQEDEFIAGGYGTERYDVMYNDFVVIGPENDPAGIADATSAADAFALIAAAGENGGAIFVSRGDDSGTNTKELAIWDAAGITPEGDWYISAGQGMGAVLTMSDEMQAYTLTDRGTYIAFEDIGLPILYEHDEVLFNPYGVIPVNPDNRPLGDSELPEQFAAWLTSVETQELIASYTINDQQLFFPSSAEYLAAQAEATAEATTEAMPMATAEATEAAQ